MLERLKEMLFCRRQMAELRAEVIGLTATVACEREAHAKSRSQLMSLVRAMRDVNADLDAKLLEAGGYGKDRRMD